MELIAVTYVVASQAGGMFASSHFLTDWLPSFLAAYIDHATLLRTPAEPEAAKAPPKRSLSGSVR